ncbi:MAG: hypothetical protein N3B01_09365 [Verrucomicrobiae bacterium]|nr:hypothetical protein [Verrucomicrobiae bacterium]
MRYRRFSLAVCLLAAASVHAEETLETLKKQLQLLQQQVQQLQEKIARLEATKIAAQTPSGETQSQAAPVHAAAAKPWTPSQPITIGRASSAYINLSLVGDVVFGWSTTPDVQRIEGGHHDPSQRGFTLQGAELTLDGAVDPYFTAMATIPLVIEPGGDTVIELEEAWVQTTSLPWNLQLKAGQMFASFGRHNQLHAHAWDFVDQPIVITRLLGGDGLRNPGAQLSWLVPLPFYTEFSLGVFNSDGDGAASFRSEHSSEIHGGQPVDRKLRSPQDLLFVPRVATSFDLSETQTLLLGVSAAVGPNNSGLHAGTQILGADLYWKWRPLNAHQGFPFVAWQTEFLYRRYEAAARQHPGAPPTPLPAETLRDWGFYSQLLWGFTRGWVAGLRGEYVTGNHTSFESDLRLDRWRLSPNLTFYPTEFSKVRLQYNYDQIQRFGDDHSVWLQLEFLIGAHAAHKF